MPRRLLSRPLLIGLAAVGVAVAAIVVAALSPWSDDGPTKPKPVTLAAHAAPTGTVAVTQHGVYGTRETAAQAAADVTGIKGIEGKPSELVPLPATAFRRPIAQWRRYALRQAADMRRDARAVVSAVRADDRAAARAAWTRTYAGYLRTGLAYGALGDLDDKLAASPGAMQDGVDDPHFGGLHRVEAGLWTDTPLPRVLPWARRLVADVDRIPHAVRTLEVEPLDYATRAHEILEDVQRDQLSGVAPQWSGAGVAATAAGVDATQRVLTTLDPLLAGRGDAQNAVDVRLRRLRTQLDRIRADHHGRWPALDALSEAEREHVQGALGAALEELALLPGELETTRPPAIKALP